MQVTRVELHALVWSEPMQHLAQRFDLSDVALAKRCRKLNIPVPGRGYWARKAAGQRVRVTPLPKARGEDDAAPIVFAERTALEEPERHEGPVLEQEQFEARPKNLITIRPRLSRRPVVSLTSAWLRARPGSMPRSSEGVLDVQASRDNISRALHFIDAFVGACEARGFAIRGYKGNDQKSFVTLLGQSIEFRLREPSRRVDLAKEARARGVTPSPHMYPRYRFEGSGHLEFALGHPYSPAHAMWRDGKLRRIDDCLNEIMVALVAIAVELNEIDAAREREEAERVRLARIAHDEREQAERESGRVAQLREDAAAWMGAQAVRAFVASLEAHLCAKTGETSVPAAVAAWVAWAYYVADDLDPLQRADPAEYVSRDPVEPVPSWIRNAMRP